MITFRAIIIISLLFLYSCGEQSNTSQEIVPDRSQDIVSTALYMGQQSGVTTQNKTSHMIVIKSDGFTPAEITINAGDTVNFINDDTSPHWPASADHPSHLLYPGSDIEKCGTPEQSNIFDACRGIIQGETYSFTFYQVGSWGYHDHLHSQLSGKIIVEDTQDSDMNASGSQGFTGVTY